MSIINLKSIFSSSLTGITTTISELKDITKGIYKGLAIDSKASAELEDTSRSINISIDSHTGNGDIADANVDLNILNNRHIVNADINANVLNGGLVDADVNLGILGGNNDCENDGSLVDANIDLNILGGGQLIDAIDA